MLDVGISELALITLAALIFIGPKDFPVVIRYARGVLHQLRNFRTGVQKQVDQIMEESGLNEIKTTTIIDLNGQPQIAYDVEKTDDLMRYSSSPHRGEVRRGALDGTDHLSLGPHPNPPPTGEGVK